MSHEVGPAVTPNHLPGGFNCGVAYFSKVRPKCMKVIHHFLYHDLESQSRLKNKEILKSYILLLAFWESACHSSSCFFPTNIRNELINTQNKTKTRFSQALRNQRFCWPFSFFFFRMKLNIVRPMIKYIVYKNALSVLHCLPLDEAGQIFFGAALTSGWRKFYLLLSFGQNRCFCRK